MANNTLAENLIRLKEAKEDIADAIVEMGGTASQYDGLEDMPDNIRTIQANPSLVTKSITANGIYDAEDDDADGYSEVTVEVPNTYSSSDNGKVVQNGSLVSQTSRTVTSNGTYDTTTNNSTIVNVPSVGANTNITITRGNAWYAMGTNVAIQYGTLLSIYCLDLEPRSGTVNESDIAITLSGLNISEYANKTMTFYFVAYRTSSNTAYQTNYLYNSNYPPNIDYVNETITIYIGISGGANNYNLAGFIYWT